MVVGLVSALAGGTLLQVVDEVASWPIRTESGRVVGPAEICLVLGMPGDGPQLLLSMGKLAFVTVLTDSVLLKRPAQFRLVSAGVDVGSGTATG